MNQHSSPRSMQRLRQSQNLRFQPSCPDMRRAIRKSEIVTNTSISTDSPLVLK